MKNKKFYKKRHMINMTAFISIFIFAIIIFSSLAVSIKNDVNNQDDIKTNENEIGISTSLAPNDNNNIINSIEESCKIKTSENANTLSDIMHGYCAATCPHGGGPCTFDITDIPTAHINQLSNQLLPDFASGGTFMGNGKWLVCDHSTGALYEIDPITGSISTGLGGGVGLTGLAYDPSTGNLYGCSTDSLYLIDPTSGAQSYIGPFNSGETHVAIACDSSGTMYTWNVEFVQPSWLYTVNKFTGQATPLFSLGVTLNYAQDGDFYRAPAGDRLFLTAYMEPGGGHLCEVDFVTPGLNIISQFEIGAQITGSAFISYDLGILKIPLPKNGPLEASEPVEVMVCNFGPNTETNVPIMVTIEKFTGTSWVIDYVDTRTVNLNPWDNVITFSNWIPTDFGMPLNECYKYQVTAEILRPDFRMENNKKYEIFNQAEGICIDVSIPYQVTTTNTFNINLKNNCPNDICCLDIEIDSTSGWSDLVLAETIELTTIPAGGSTNIIGHIPTITSGWSWFRVKVAPGCGGEQIATWALTAIVGSTQRSYIIQHP